MPPRATYRLQFTPDFGFDAAAGVAPYLAKLGVSHLYASPYFKSRPGSTHGYDITDHNVINPELGGLNGHARMSAALKAAGLKQILDFVPNHMGIGGGDNPLWADVLEWGPDSAYAGWFDIDWESDQAYLRDKLLVPALGAQYGTELEGGKLELKFDPFTGSFAVWAYGSHKLPICPLHYGEILGDDDPTLERIGDGFSGLPAWRPQVLRRAEGLKAELVSAVRRDPVLGRAVEAAVARLNGTPGEAGSWAKLDALVRRQFWRVAHFRVAADDINYRRFFNINDLAGLRMELPAVFDHAHRTVAALLRDGTIDGLRIDHIDGLLDPKGYLERLRARAPRRGEPFYLVVEKILAPGEPLLAEWPVDGTTGYEVTNQLLNVLIDPAGEAGFTRAYADFAGELELFSKTLRASKKRIMDNEMSSELNSLARDVTRIARRNPKTSDFTRNLLRRALREVVANFSVYRTYLDFGGQLSDISRRYLDEAIAGARGTESSIDGSAYDFLHGVLSGDIVAGPKSGLSRSDVMRAAMRFQQYTGPVTAKGLEDTAFYRFYRFLALNEVGGHPTTFGRTLGSFHEANIERAQHWPHAMLTTSTHDTKRGEDARARLAVLSEMPDAWAEAAKAWGHILGPMPTEAGPERQPDRNDEYAFLQMFVGSCPMELLGSDAPDPAAVSAFADRLKGAMTKALREAKVHSTWADPNESYEAATLAFIDRALTGERSQVFLGAALPFVGRVARLGVENSLVQTALKLTMPGMPDLYQGTEFWDFSMVDPDNRRPVDFAERAAALDEVLSDLGRDPARTFDTAHRDWHGGRVKLALTAVLLAVRRDDPALFANGDYAPLAAAGPEADAICAFVRRHEDRSILVAVARFPARREAGGFDPRTEIPLPPGIWADALTGRRFEGESASVGDLFSILPAAVLLPAG